MEDTTFALTTYDDLTTFNTYDDWNITEEVYSNSTVTTLFEKGVIQNRTTSNSFGKEVYQIIIAEMILSMICLILGIVVYSILPEFKNVHGKNLISLSSCLLVTYLLLCLDLALRRHVSYRVCFSIAVAIHAMFLATFFWTNVMTFDIYNNITSMKPRSEVGRRTSRKYLKYSVYAWSATMLATVPAIVLESSDIVPLKYRPQFGVKRCWLSGTRAFIFYFNLPVGVILLGNLIMFALTVRRLYVIKKTTAVLQIKKQQQKLNLYLKLFLVMGIVWFSEFLPWISGYYFLYMVAGILTALHGVFLFIIFVLKRRIFVQIEERFSGNKAYKSSTSQQTMSTSQSSTIPKYADSQEDRF